jgi:hypothetical protein
LLIIPAISSVSHATKFNLIDSLDNNDNDSGWHGTNDGKIICRVEYDTKFYSGAIWYVILYAEKVDKQSIRSYTVQFTLYDYEKGRTLYESLTISMDKDSAAMILYPQDLSEGGNWKPEEFFWDAGYKIQPE